MKRPYKIFNIKKLTERASCYILDFHTFMLLLEYTNSILELQSKIHSHFVSHSEK